MFARIKSLIRNISLDWNEKEILQDLTIRTVKLQLPMFNILAENKFEILFLGVVHKLRLQYEVGRWSKNVHFLSTFIP